MTDQDRVLWILLSRAWADWRGPLTLVQPETVIRWHRRGFRRYWRWKSRPRWPGLRRIPQDLRDLIRQMSIVSVDLFTVPTATFRVLFVFLVLTNERRRIVHFNVTDSPSAAWTGQQVVEAFPWDTAPSYLLRDRDGVFGEDFVRRVESMDIKQVLISARSPWQNPYVERIIGSIRRECMVGGLHHRYFRRAA